MASKFTTKLKHKHRLLQPWYIWALGSSFFFAEYFARVVPSVMVHNLMVAFNVGAIALGGLAAVFYFPYLAMQIPVGSMMDRYGPRRLLALTALLCGLGAFGFALASTFWMALLSRAVMGFAAAFAFVGALKLATLWFEPRRMGLLAGLTQGMGMLGAALGVAGFTQFVHSMGWRQTMALIALILIAIGVLIALFVKDRRPALLSRRVNNASQIGTIEGLKVVFRNPSSWFNAMYLGLLYGPTGAFAAFWGPSFLERTYHLSRGMAGLAVSMIFIGWGVSAPISGFFSDAIGRRKPLLYGSALFSLIFLSIILYIPHLPITLLFIVLFAYGVSNSGVAIAYAVASEQNPHSVSGVSIAFANMCSLVTTPALQQLVGWLIVLSWAGKRIVGIPFYSAQNYRHAMLILPLCLVFAFIAVFFIKETHCQRR